MTTAVCKEPVKQGQEFKPLLYQVWIDLRFGEDDPDWWWNSEPQPLSGALRESEETRAEGWHCQVRPEGDNPRPDGRWDNP